MSAGKLWKVICEYFDDAGVAIPTDWLSYLSRISPDEEEWRRTVRKKAEQFGGRLPSLEEFTRIEYAKRPERCPRCSELQAGMRLGYRRHPYYPKQVTPIAVRCICKGGPEAFPEDAIETDDYNFAWLYLVGGD